MLPIAVECGISIFDYWEMTFGEITLTIEQYNKKLEYNRKRDYALARLIAGFVNLSLAGQEIPSYERLYNIETEDTKAAMLYMEQWKDFAERQHKKFLELKQ